MATQPPVPERGRTKGLWTPRRILLVVLVAYGIILALFNLDTVDISFVFFSTRASLFVVIVLALAVGFLAGYLFDGFRDRRRSR